MRYIFPETWRLWLKKELILVISLAAALLSCLLNPPSAAYISFINFKVLSCLFCLMAVVRGLAEEHVLCLAADTMVACCRTVRQLTMALVGLTFLASMLITNDVALLTFVPLTLLLTADCFPVKQTIYMVVLQTLAANLGSMLTPIGNPQNLYLFSFYRLSFGEFLRIVLPVVMVAAIGLWGNCFLLSPKQIVPLKEEKPDSIHGRRLVLYLVWFIFSLLAVFGYVSFVYVSFFVFITAFVFHKYLLRKIDYSLLLTFVAFFIFAGNLSSSVLVREFLCSLTNKNTLLLAAFCSQFMSNVPTAVFLSVFTGHYQQLILGVDIGGCGTIIASLASIISYKFFYTCYPKQAGRYLLVFTIWNMLYLTLLLSFASFYLAK